MRWPGAMLVGCTLATGCFGERPHECSSGSETWLCPSNLECSAPPAYCGASGLIEQCKGKMEFDACDFTSTDKGVCLGIGADGTGGVCTHCTHEIEGCQFPGWNPMTSGTAADLHAVWAIDGDAHAAGASSTMLHYDGQHWAAEPFPTLATGAYVNGMWGIAGNDIYAVATSGEVFHFDGMSWSQVAMFPTIAGGVGGVPGHVVVAGGNGTVMEDVSGTWTTTPKVLNLPAVLTGVWGIGTDIFVAGGGGLVLRYAGSWQVSRAAGGSDPQLNAVWASSTNDVYAVGNHGATTTIYSNNGAGWSPEAVVGTLDLFGVSGTGPSDVYAVGASGAILHKTAGTWDQTTVSPQTMYAVTTSPRDIYVVGQQGQIWRYTR